MPEPEIEEFAEQLVTHVRDAAIRNCDLNRRPESQSVTAKRWRRSAVPENSKAIDTVIPDCVDDALFFLLNAIDQGLLRLRFETADGRVVDLAENGELAGWYVGAGGWRERYSKERLADYSSEEEG